MFQYIFLAIAGFLAQFVDAIAGGGGLISLPALLLIGIPIKIAAGTNKLGAVFGTTAAAYNYASKGYCNFKLILMLAPFTLVGAIIGTLTFLKIDSSFLSPIIMILIGVISVYTVFKKEIGTNYDFKGINKKTIVLGACLAFVMGFYDGFFGPGTGSFLIFGLIKIYGFDFVHSSANAKFLNLTSNVTSLFTFLFAGSVDIKLGLFYAFFMVIGSYTGSNMAMKVGSKLIKPIFIIISIATMIKVGFQYF